MTSKSPYFIRITEDELPGFMAGKGDAPTPKAAPDATAHQATDAYTRWPGWGPLTGVGNLNAYGPGGTSTWTATTTAAVGRRAWPTLVIIALVVLGLGSLAVAWKMRLSDQPSPSPSPAVQVEATAVPTAPPTPQPTVQTLAPAAPVILGAAVPPVMVVICDGVRYELRSFRQLVALVHSRGASWPHGCATDSDWWSVARQYAWQDAHP